MRPLSEMRPCQISVPFDGILQKAFKKRDLVQIVRFIGYSSSVFVHLVLAEIGLFRRAKPAQRPEPVGADHDPVRLA